MFWQVYGALCENKEKWPSFCYYFCLPPSVPPARAHFLIYRWALTQHTHLSRFRLHLEGKNNNNFLIAEIKFAIPVFRSFSLLTRAHIFICLLSTVFLFPSLFPIVSLQCKSWLHFMYISIIFPFRSYRSLCSLRFGQMNRILKLIFVFFRSQKRERIFFSLVSPLRRGVGGFDGKSSASCNLIYYCRQIYFMITRANTRNTKEKQSKETKKKWTQGNFSTCTYTRTHRSVLVHVKIGFFPWSPHKKSND